MESNEHSIVADMLNISFYVEQITDNYHMDIEPLNLNTVDYYLEFDKDVNIEDLNFIVESANVYKQLHQKLPRYK